MALFSSNKLETSGGRTISTDNRIIVQKGLNEKNNVDFSYDERKKFYKNVSNATNFSFDIGKENCMERFHFIISDF